VRLQYLELHYRPMGIFSLYEGDGKTFNFRRGDVMRLQSTWSDRGRTFETPACEGFADVAVGDAADFVREAGARTDYNEAGG